MSKNLKSFSVIIPCFNSEEYAKNALQSIVDNDYPLDKIEVLVIDDGSKDVNGFYKTIESFFISYPNTFKFFKKTNGNWGSVINYAKNNNIINNDLVVILDSDDKFKKSFFKTVNKKIKDADVFVGSFTVIENRSKFKGQPYYFLKKKLQGDEKYTATVFPACIVYKKELFIKTRDLPEGVSFQDCTLFFGILQTTSNIRWTTKNIATYWRSRPGNTMTSEFNDKKLSSQLIVYETLKKTNIDDFFYWFFFQKNFTEALVKKGVKLEFSKKPNYCWAPFWMRWVFHLLLDRKIKKVVVYKNEKE